MTDSGHPAVISDSADAHLERIIAARERCRPYRPPSDARPLSVAEGYAIQDRLRDALTSRGERVIGWKAGFTSRAAQHAFDCHEPASGFLLASGVFADRAEVPLIRFVELVVEAEIALVLRADLAGPGVTVTEALCAVEGALPALELVDFRCSGKPLASDVIADGVFANAIVLGAPLTPVAGLDLALEGLVYEQNGAIVATNTAAEVMGSPINSLAWLANNLGERGLGLRSGDIVMTGSVSALLRPKAGDTVRATYTRLGSVSARFG